MTPQSEALQMVITAVNTAADCTVRLTQLPTGNGITAEITGSEPKGRNLKLQHGKEDLTVLFLCKNTNQQAAFDTLCTIGNTLDALGALEGTTVYVIGAGVRSGAGLVGKEGNYYIYSMIAKITISF